MSRPETDRASLFAALTQSVTEQCENARADSERYTGEGYTHARGKVDAFEYVLALIRELRFNAEFVPTSDTEGS